MLLATKVVMNGFNVDIHNHCMYCGKDDQYTIRYDKWIEWQEEGKYIQDVFPNIADSEREFMLSGTHPECWKQLFQETE